MIRGNACLAFLIFSIPVHACLNEHYGHPPSGVEEVKSPLLVRRWLNEGKHKQDYWEAKKQTLEASVKTSDDYKLHSDYAVALIHLGGVKEAIKILEKIEKEHPGEYATAANLGTAYELNGELPKALQWIKKGYELNPQSHEGSEWLHVKILESKIAIQSDPDWIKSHSVLGMNFGDSKAPAQPGEISSEPSKYSKAILYQLHERLAFVNPKDPTVGSLFFDLGNITTLSESWRYSNIFYSFANEYGVANQALLSTRRGYIQFKVNIENGIYTLVGISIAIFLGASVLYIKDRLVKFSKKMTLSAS
jgi:tetratricopeptide (TPR) repeat protein